MVLIGEVWGTGISIHRESRQVWDLMDDSGESSATWKLGHAPAPDIADIRLGDKGVNTYRTQTVMWGEGNAVRNLCMTQNRLGCNRIDIYLTQDQDFNAQGEIVTWIFG